VPFLSPITYIESVSIMAPLKLILLTSLLRILIIRNHITVMRLLVARAIYIDIWLLYIPRGGGGGV
jgi:hypothetical protein